MVPVFMSSALSPLPNLRWFRSTRSALWYKADTSMACNASAKTKKGEHSMWWVGGDGNSHLHLHSGSQVEVAGPVAGQTAQQGEDEVRSDCSVLARYVANLFSSKGGYKVGEYHGQCQLAEGGDNGEKQGQGRRAAAAGHGEGIDKGPPATLGARLGASKSCIKAGRGRGRLYQGRWRSPERRSWGTE